jgi:hypothetical protein
MVLEFELITLRWNWMLRLEPSVAMSTVGNVVKRLLGSETDQQKLVPPREPRVGGRCSGPSPASQDYWI